MRAPSGEMVAFEEELTNCWRPWERERGGKANKMINASISPIFKRANKLAPGAIFQSPLTFAASKGPLLHYILNCTWKKSCSGSGRLNEFTSPYAGAKGTVKYLFSGTPLAATSFGLDPLKKLLMKNLLYV